jgi:hypothetical protein
MGADVQVYVFFIYLEVSGQFHAPVAVPQG